jgi:radical SAM superfamily enzyme YgiQ (UPF0313 family)
MRLLLVRPARTPQSVTLGEIMFSEPIGLEMVASALKGRHEIRLLDLMAVPNGDLASIFAEFRPEVVGLTSLCVDVPAVHKLVKRAKALNPGIVTIVGGTQAFLNPEAFFIPEMDHVMRFTTPENLNALFDALEAVISGNGGSSNPGPDACSDACSPGPENFPRIDGVHSKALNYSDSGARQPNAYWLPDREITAPWRHLYAYFGYRPCAILQTSQGCSAHCDFCLRWRMEGPCEKEFPLEFVMADLKAIREPSAMIFDNDFLNNGPRLFQFCEGLEQEGIHKNFICYASVHSVLENPKAILKFRDLGLKAVLMGYESHKDQDLADYKKRSVHADNLRAAQWLKSAGIDVWASFILHPDWDHKDFRDFRKNLRVLSPEITTFSPLTPFPNLPMYQQYKDRLMFAREDYAAWSFGQVTIRPGRMSLRAYYIEVLKSILYLNFVSNHLSYVVKRFGSGTLLRLARGSVKVFGRYVALMWKAGNGAAKDERNI